MDLTNAHIISNQERPYPNSPAYPPAFPFDRNYLNKLVTTGTSDYCEYSCDGGYKVQDAGTETITVPGSPIITTITATTELRTTPTVSGCNLS